MPPSRVEKKAAYLAWLIKQDLRFGFAGEIANLADRVRDGVSNATPPDRLWPAIVPTVRLLEMVRTRFGPTSLHSAFRSPAYNKAVGGESASRHMHNDAVDFVCATGTPRDWALFLRGLRDAGRFTGGIGVYKTFVHVDTRGTVADWKR